jgi:exodeoxyribonuclease VII large subunit
MADTVFSVSQVSEYLEKKLLLDPMLTRVKVRGEITNFSLSSKGQAYFSIKDAICSLSCIIFDTSIIAEAIENGSMVVVSGEIGFYKKFGKINLIVNSISLEGKGDLYEKFLLTKDKLEDEGLFDEKYKKPIPRFPFNIGVITSAAGAAMHDIVNVATRRFPEISIKIYSAVVQGDDAPADLIHGLDYFNNEAVVDLVIIGRGGGSFEDLFAFNDENLARKIFESKIPVVSAVGHEIDYSISDFVADLRAPTPSVAAEICIPTLSDIIGNIEYYKERFGDILGHKVTKNESYLNEKKILLERFSPSERITAKQARLDLLIKSFEDRIQMVYNAENSRLSEQKEKLTALSPNRILSRGFSYVTDLKGKVINSAKKLDKGKDFMATFADGSIYAKVIKKKEEE